MPQYFTTVVTECRMYHLNSPVYVPGGSRGTNQMFCWRWYPSVLKFLLSTSWKWRWAFCSSFLLVQFQLQSVFPAIPHWYQLTHNKEAYLWHATSKQMGVLSGRAIRSLFSIAAWAGCKRERLPLGVCQSPLTGATLPVSWPCWKSLG